MRAPRIRSLRWGAAYAAVLPLAAFAVHELRYVLTYGGHAGAVLQRTGHAYLHSLVPWLILCAGLAVGGYLRALGRVFARHTAPARYSLSLVALWLACAASLLALYVLQESLEGLFTTGHATGLAAGFSFGGWWAVPAALIVGLVVAVVLHGARWVLRELERRLSDGPGRRRATVAPRPAGGMALPRLAPLAAGWSGRGPPR